jgi:hypothetical protein
VLMWKGESELVARATFEPRSQSLSTWKNRGFRLRNRSNCVKPERWLYPVIQLNLSRNMTEAMQISFEPRQSFPHFAANAPRAKSETGGRP